MKKSKKTDADESKSEFVKNFVKPLMSKFGKIISF